jgi:uncharacterized protein YraI
VVGTIKAQPNVNIRSGPGTQYTATRTVPYGQTFKVLCYARGTTVSGWGGTNPYWDLLQDPANSSRALGYVADV